MEKTLKLHNDDEARNLFGRHDEHLTRIEEAFRVRIVARGEDLTVSGEEVGVAKAARVLTELLAIARSGQAVRRQELEYALKAVQTIAPASHPSLGPAEQIAVPSKHRFVSPRTPGQQRYVEAIRTHDIVFGIGPAGTGKTYLAMAMAISALTKGEVSRIILTRPAVEAGESLGFLPGDLTEKITPYLRPLYDALYDMMEIDKIQRFVERGIIEVAPLAYMRGRTLNDSFIILDEAQNSTSEQMKMFLTRLGFDSKTVITGDVTQVDLPADRLSGLIQAQQLLRLIEGIAFIEFSGEDVVRHELVQEIIRAYESRGNHVAEELRPKS